MTAADLDLARENELNHYLDGLAANEKFAEIQEQEAVDLIECRMAEMIEEMQALKDELQFSYGDLEHLDFKQMILDEVEGRL